MPDADDTGRPKNGLHEVTRTKAGRSAAFTPHRQPLIVAIGASAGGLAAFKTFFSKTPPDTGMAFVLVQHLDPNHKSMLAEITGRHTEMPVVEAQDGALIVANTVFVIPPDATLTVSSGILHVERPAPPRLHRWPINTFFSSLAKDQGENAVCIVLAGTGSDGTLGVGAIKEHGGLAMAQSEYDHIALSGMPESAAATGLVDYVMHAEDMPAKLVQYNQHLTDVAAKKSKDGLRLDAADHLAIISGLLRARLGHDFSHYKTNTLIRRIQRRMQVLEIDTMPAFIERLRKEPGQLDSLFCELLIGVTQFFRDPPAFKALQSVALPSVLKDKGDADQVRIWVPGCSTGEEVYSITILLKEALDQVGIAPRVQIFGTDIDENAIASARAGRYPKTMTGLSPERIERWFVAEDDGYRVVKQIREMCVFSLHSLVKDPPFSKLDLISCRNVLIYLNTDLQETVIRTFHYALRPDGILFLGPSESINRNGVQFNALDNKYRIYQRRETGIPTHLPHYSAQAVRFSEDRVPARSLASGEDRIVKSIRFALERHSPVYVLINDQLEILRFSGGETGRYLEPADGVASLNLFSNLRQSLRPTVRAAVQKVFSSKQALVQDDVPIEIDGEMRTVTVIVEPIIEGNNNLCIVAFRDLDRNGRHRSVKGEPGTKNTTENTTVQALEAELLATRARLRIAVDAEEAATQEIKSSAEEYQSVNEELQSSNEELETAKEEMQSVNEELQTIIQS